MGAGALVYCFIDIELDGPSPGLNSMLSFACVACAEDGTELGIFVRNVVPLEGSSAEPSTAEWWQSQPDAWAEITHDPQEPDVVMPAFVKWIETLPGEPVLAAHPLMLDGVWLDWYLRRFAGTRVFSGLFPGKPLFVGGGIDVPSYVQGAMNLPYFRRRPDYPEALLDGVPHSHKPVDDARGHAALYFNARRALRAGR